jgi:hypothetical protein
MITLGIRKLILIQDSLYIKWIGAMINSYLNPFQKFCECCGTSKYRVGCSIIVTTFTNGLFSGELAYPLHGCKSIERFTQDIPITLVAGDSSFVPLTQ